MEAATGIGSSWNLFSIRCNAVFNFDSDRMHHYKRRLEIRYPFKKIKHMCYWFGRNRIIFSLCLPESGSIKMCCSDWSSFFKNFSVLENILGKKINVPILNTGIQTIEYATMLGLYFVRGLNKVELIKKWLKNKTSTQHCWIDGLCFLNPKLNTTGIFPSLHFSFFFVAAILVFILIIHQHFVQSAEQSAIFSFNPRSDRGSSDTDSDVTKGDLSSNGTIFLFTVMSAFTSVFSASFCL